MAEVGPTQTVVPGEQWDPRPRTAFVVGVLIRAMPFLVSMLAVWAASRLLPRPNGWWVATWWLGLVIVAQVVVFGANHLVVRLLPISMLLRMSLAFPDKAPSRVGTALRSGNVEKLRRSLQDDAGDDAGDGSSTALDDAIVEALALVRALNVHDRGTRGHSERVRAYSEVLGEELGLNAEERERLRWGAILHDVGKLTVPASILNSSGRPSEAEWAVLRKHPAEGGRILAPLASWLGDAVHAADQHHERWDGGGYPRGLGGDEIALSGRIVAVADAFAVMTMARSYKKPYSIEVARRELAKGAGTQFDPMVVRAMLGLSVGRLNKLSGPLAALANIPLIGPLLGPLVVNAPALPAALASGATALLATTAAVASSFGPLPGAGGQLGDRPRPPVAQSSRSVSDAQAVAQSPDPLDDRPRALALRAAVTASSPTNVVRLAVMSSPLVWTTSSVPLSVPTASTAVVRTAPGTPSDDLTQRSTPTSLDPAVVPSSNPSSPTIAPIATHPTTSVTSVNPVNSSTTKAPRGGVSRTSTVVVSTTTSVTFVSAETTPPIIATTTTSDTKPDPTAPSTTTTPSSETTPPATTSPPSTNPPTTTSAPPAETTPPIIATTTTADPKPKKPKKP